MSTRIQPTFLRLSVVPLRLLSAPLSAWRRSRLEWAASNRSFSNLKFISNFIRLLLNRQIFLYFKYLGFWGFGVLGFWPAKVLSPGRVSLLLMGEIIVGAVTSMIWAGEALVSRELIGGVLIISAGLVEVFGNKPNNTSGA